MSDRGLVKIGVIGSVIAVLCCFTPILVILFGAVGLSATVGYLDYVLFPALAVFLAVLGFGLYRRNYGRTKRQAHEVGE